MTRHRFFQNFERIFFPTARKKTVAFNTFYNVMGYGVRMIIGLFLTPYIVTMLGVERFGIWAVTAIVTGYLGLFDFGIGVSFVKYLSEFYAKNEVNRMNKVVSVGFLVYLLFTVLMIVLCVLFREQFFILFKIPSSLQEEAAIALFVSILVFGMTNAFHAFSVMPMAVQRFDIANIVSVASAVLGAVFTVFVLKWGYGLTGLVLSNALIIMMQRTADICIAYALIPKLNFNVFSFDREVFKQLFRFGFAMQIAKVSGWISTQIDKILVGVLLSLNMITYYELGSTIVAYVIGVSSLVVSPLLPAFTDIRTNEKEEQLVSAYVTSLRYGSCLILPLFAFMAVSGPLMMKIWMGENYLWIGGLVTILSFAFMINSIAQIAASMCMAIDRPNFLSTGSVITISLNVVLSFLFIKLYGFWGAAWGTVIAVNAGTFYFLFMLHKKIKFGFGMFLKTILPFMGASGIAVMGILIFDFTIHKGFFLNDWQILLIRGIIFSGLYGLFVWWKKCLREQ